MTEEKTQLELYAEALRIKTKKELRVLINSDLSPNQKILAWKEFWSRIPYCQICAKKAPFHRRMPIDDKDCPPNLILCDSCFDKVSTGSYEW
jgi:hypothetical protein